MTELPEPLDRPPSVEDGDNSQAGGGKPASPVDEDELADAPDLDEEDDDPDVKDDEDVDADDTGTA